MINNAAVLDDNSTYRMVSWWFNWSDLEWPLPQLEDKFKYRADALWRGGATHAMVFGAHFRWDFMPLWEVFHDMLHFVSNELRARGIKLYDHHSATLTHRYSGRDDLTSMRYKNRHHVTFAPSQSVADELVFGGQKLNDWRMVDVISGKVANPGYTAEIFCINNPGFRRSYNEYLKKLIMETGIDGVEVDDCLFYPRFYACGCSHCRDGFKREGGVSLPHGDDLSFWGNWENPQFRSWISFRNRSVENFLSGVKAVLPSGFPLMSCCSGSYDSAANETSCTYENFIKACNVVMLEVCGNFLSADGGVVHSLAAQLHHMAIARKNGVPCISLGYGHCAGEAGVVWSFNKWLGCGTWFSTLKGRLGLRDVDLSAIPDDHDLIGGPYLFEKRFPEIFLGRSGARIAVLYSRSTRDNYGGYMSDYADDYRSSCLAIFDAGMDAEVVLEVPSVGDPYDVVLISSAVCMSDADIDRVHRWISSGGAVVATGPIGFRDERGDRRDVSLLCSLGVSCGFHGLSRDGKFPHDTWDKMEPANCTDSGGWITVCDRRFYWNSQRVSTLEGDAVCAILRPLCKDADIGVEAAAGWYVRRFLLGNGVVAMHVLCSKYTEEGDGVLAEKRYYDNGMRIVKSVAPAVASSSVAFRLLRPARSAQLFIPMSNSCDSLMLSDRLEVVVPSGCYYFIVVVSFEEECA